ncbi:MAG: FHA domain-containing protein [Bradymonadales bacterium]|nr:MAG: FHA domain-containing protein [Bradymonadales bacterium]
MSKDRTQATKVIRWEEQPTHLRLAKCKLSVLSGDQKSKDYTLSRPVIRVGTKSDNEIVIKDDTMSRNHFEIKQTKEGYLLSDKDSRNGVFINGVRIKEAFLSPGAVIRAGKTELKFSPEDETFEVVPSNKNRYAQLIGGSTAMRKIYTIIEKIAPTDVTVIIEGESGTGKELVAAAIHEKSKRSKRPFVVFDCSSVAENLIESELFGHEKGSFTGATGLRHGAFELADSGSIFLDEIGELVLDLQPKLLRALESRSIRRVGGDRVLPVDVRVVAATNRNLESEVKKGSFREDLFYRLNVVPIYLPPLRKRKEDIPMLVEHFIQIHNESQPDQAIEGITSSAMEILMSHEWPGNVRELRNTISRALSLMDGKLIEPDDIPERVRVPIARAELEIRDDLGFKDAKEQWIGAFEKQYLEDILKKSKYNISAAAKEAGIDRKSVQRLMKKYGISEGNGDDSED